MADDAPAPEEGGEDKKRNLLPLIVVGAVMLLVGGGGGAAVMSMMSDDPGGEAATDSETVGEPGSADAQVPDLVASSEVIALGSFQVNLRDSAGGRLLQMELSVEASGDAAAMVEEREAQIRDAILMLASDYSFLELEGLEGKLRLRDEIHRRANTVLAPEKVDRVYFTAFVVQ